MKKYLLNLLAFLSFIPSLPYLFQAWKSSRLDSWDWLFYLAAIPASLWALRQNKPEKWDWRALLIALPALFLAVTKSWHQVNALSVLGSVAFVWAMTFLTGGWTFAYRLFPCLLLAALGTPSSSYRLAQMLMFSTAAAMGLKMLLAAGCFGWIFINKRLNKVVKMETLLFSGVVLASCTMLIHADELYFTGASRIPAFPTHAGRFYGRPITPDENTRRFFATSQVKQYRYLAGNQEISVLAVRCGKDVHEIHPASHCLRTSRWVVTDEKIFTLRPDFAVTEIEARKGNTRALIWVWYANDKFSTPGFLGFRRRFRPDGNYHTFQISVPFSGKIETARQILKEFISVLPQEKIK